MNEDKSQQKNAMQQKMMEMCGNMSMEECQAMMSRMMNKTNEPDFSSLQVEQNQKIVGTPELQTLFFEWCNQIKDEMKAYSKSMGKSDLDTVSEHFKLSVESCKYILEEF